MTYTTSQNIKTRTTYMAAALFATLILVAGIAALAMYPAEAFAKPLCAGNDSCYASVNANTADSASSLCNSMTCIRSAIEGKLCAKRCLSGNGPAFIDENDNGICDNYEKGLCPGKGLDYGNGNDWGSDSSTQNGNTYGYSNGNGYGACANGNGCGYAYSHGHGACGGFVNCCQRAKNCPNR